MNIQALVYKRLFSPQPRISQPSLKQVRKQMIDSFKRWGMPECIRVDNGQPFGDPQRVTVPPMALWLICLDIKVIWNRPRRPTDNPKVERMQGTTSRWAEAKHAQDCKQLQARLDCAIERQRSSYPVERLGGKTRLEAYPELEQAIRQYCKKDFDPRRAYDFLAHTRFVRKVSSTGRVTIYEQGYQVGRQWQRQQVGITFDPTKRQWVFCDNQGNEIRRHKAKRLTKKHLWELSISQKKKT